MNDEHPILFDDASIRSILAGRKTQTRRPVVAPKSVCRDWEIDSTQRAYDVFWPKEGYRDWGFLLAGDQGIAEVRCPFGVPGDRLWVREAWREVGSAQMEDGSIPQDKCECRYRADDPSDGPWRPSIHMPRWACRLSLRVDRVRVENVRDITEDDAWAEGMPLVVPADGRAWDVDHPHRSEFAYQWAKRHTDRGLGWAYNPLVWVCEFSVIYGRED